MEVNRVTAGSLMFKHGLEALDLIAKNPLVISAFMGISPGGRMNPGRKPRTEKSDECSPKSRIGEVRLFSQHYRKCFPEGAGWIKIPKGPEPRFSLTGFLCRLRATKTLSLDVRRIAKCPLEFPMTHTPL
jgi:hypothetical protein